MNKIIRKIMPVIFVIAVLFCVLFLNRAMKSRNAEEISTSYYDQPAGKTDIVFVGTSAIMNGIYPMELWHDYGFTSFNLGSGNQSLGQSYYLIKEVIERDHPSLVVLDCSRAFRDEVIAKASYLHYVSDNMPMFSKNRIGMISELSGEFDEEQVKALYFPLIEYHTRWTEITKKDFDRDEKTYTFGSKVDNRLTVSDEYKKKDIVTENAISERSLAYFDRITKLCKENDTELLLLTLPVISVSKYISQPTYTLRRNAAYALEEYAAKNRTGYLNLIDGNEEIGLDPEYDTVDGQHLNYTGALKMTDYLGTYIRENYRVTDHRPESAYAYLNDAYEDYRNYLDEKLLISTNRMDIFLNALEKASRRDDCIVVVMNTTDPEKTKLNPMEDYADLFRRLGLTGSFAGNFYAVIDEGNVVAEGSIPEANAGYIYDKIHYDDPVRGLKISLDPSDPAVIIDGMNRISGTNGFQAVVYNKKKHDLMDSLSADTAQASYSLVHWTEQNISFDN
ncbi:MAG: hypothetical protein K6G61_00620 [Solobacterium sp.]|nr:hypothetical protein [Solobacterium sp.]